MSQKVGAADVVGQRHELEPALPWCFVPEKARPRWLAGEGDQGDFVSLPHSWNEHDSYRPGLDYRRGWGSYRVCFEVESAQEGVVLEAGGFYGRAEVWLNGQRIARGDGQYLGLRQRLTPWLRPGSNVLGLQLENRYHRDVLPGRRDPDFVLYGGLAGGARLLRLPTCHLQDRSSRVRIGIEPLPGSPDRASVELAVPVRNESRGERSVLVRWSLADSDGTRLARAQTARRELARTREEWFQGRLEVEEIRRWSPRDPVLYRLVTELVEDDTVLDVEERRLGFRHAAFGARGFELDGERLRLHGCNRHESLPGFASALPAALHRADAELLKSIGANFVRLSHYPQSPAFLDACDELGLFVYAELASWKSVRGGRWLEAARRQWRAMIERDRHRPSVLVWGMGNESRSRPAFVELTDMARELDPDRPVSYAENHLYRARRKSTVGLADVWGLNYELDVLEEARAASRLGCVLVTECMNACLRDRPPDLEERQLAAMAEEWPAIARHDWVAGHLIWSFADYATPYRRRYRRTPGLFDAWRSPRVGAWLFRARHGREPFVHLDADWSRQGGDGERRVRLFTNLDRVELRCGERTLASLETAAPMVELDVEFEDQPLRATSQVDGETVACRLDPWGEAQRIVLHAAESLRDERADLVPLSIEVVDDRGARVRDYRGSVVVEAGEEGRLRTFDGAGTVELTAGVGRTWLELTPEGRPVRVTATGPELEPGERVISGETAPESRP